MPEVEDRFACPKCGNTDRLDVVITTSARIKQYGPEDIQTDADESMDGSHEWDGDSIVHCTACGHSDKCSTFDREWEPEPIRCTACGTQREHLEVQRFITGYESLVCCEMVLDRNLEANACPETYSCPKCGTPHSSTDYEDESEGDEAGRTFRYCSEACRESH